VSDAVLVEVVDAFHQFLVDLKHLVLGKTEHALTEVLVQGHRGTQVLEDYVDLSNRVGTCRLSSKASCIQMTLGCCGSHLSS
jgi:hypothetical protein